jgi:NAD(P)-dependent dehydrogenase (short-subunit alcohol dehydrogenase family)
MGALDGRVAVITGAGGGLGRAHALHLAAEGARVVVNDRGADTDGTGSDSAAAEAVVEEIRAAGGTAIANDDDVADWDGGRRIVDAAVDAFGRLDVLVNNAGVLRDRALATMEEDDWDAVVRVHLKGHFVPTRWAAAHWRERHKAGEDVQASIVHTSSTSGLLGNPGQTNYGAAKAGVAGFSLIAAQELARYGVRSNCIVPAARTRLTESVPGLGDLVQAPRDGFDVWDPANVSPVVAYLATASCPFNGATFYVQGGTVRLMDPWHIGDGLDRDSRWSIEELAIELAKYAPP